MHGQTVPKCACSLHLAVAIAVLLPYASAIFLPIVPLPISFNFGGSSPMTMDVTCSWGTLVEVDGAKQVRQGCGAARHSWKVFYESGAGSEVPLGNLAHQQKLTLTLAPQRGSAVGVLTRSGTYLVQLSMQYDRCGTEQGQTRVVIGPCPASDEGASTQSYELQACKDVGEPGKRQLSLLSSGQSRNVQWQVVPQANGAVSSEAGQQTLTCNGAQCTMLVGSGAGKVSPGRSYTIKYSVETTTAAPAPAPQASAGIGFGFGLGGFGFGFGAGAPAAPPAPATAVVSSGWRELKGVTVDKCPPRVTRSTAAMMGTCGGQRWLEMQVSAVDMEEGAAGAGGLKFYWYVLSARTQDVVAEASGPLVKLDVGVGPGKVPEGRRYTVNLVVTSSAGGQVASTRQTVAQLLDIPSC